MSLAFCFPSAGAGAATTVRPNEKAAAAAKTTRPHAATSKSDVETRLKHD
jgi:hypothetical protein